MSTKYFCAVQPLYGRTFTEKLIANQIVQLVRRGIRVFLKNDEQHITRRKC